MSTLGAYIDELRELDQHNMGSWPAWAYGLAIAFVSLVIMLISGWYFVLPKRATLTRAIHTETQLKNTFRTQQPLAANLDAYRERLSQKQTEFSHLLDQLPTRSEVPNLLRDISQARSENGLDEKLFKPATKTTRGFYTVLPNDLVVTGTFHQFGHFISDVAALPGIVTVSNIHIEPMAPGKSGTVSPDAGTLRMHLTATTYRYFEDKNAPAAEDKSAS